MTENFIKKTEIIRKEINLNNENLIHWEKKRWFQIERYRVIKTKMRQKN